MSDTVIFSNGIGNFVLATPFISRLNSPSIIIPAEDHRLAAIRSISMWPVEAIPMTDISGAIRDRDRVFALWGTYPKRSLFGIKNITSQPTPNWRTGEHEARNYLKMIPDSPDYVPSTIKVGTAWTPYIGKKEKLLVFCNGASLIGKGWSNKQWPHFEALAQLIRKELPFVQIAFLGDKNEAAFGSRIVRLLGERCWNFAGQISLDQSARVIQCADLVITNDTGLMHIADALNKKMIVLWGFTLLSKNYPWNATKTGLAKIIKSNGGECARFPCFFETGTRTSCTSGACMSAISPQEVLQEIASVLE
jgi:ADP-heptose:LPS heptosyltransferase